MRESMSFQIGSTIGSAIGTVIFWCGKFIFLGIFKAPIKSTIIAVAYIVYSIAFSVSLFGYFIDCPTVIITFLITAFICGIWYDSLGYAFRQRRKYFYSIFEKIKMYSMDGKLPTYLYEKEVSDYAFVIAFHTLIPISEWENKKDVLEMYLNIKIADMKQDEKDNQKLYIIVQTNPLPTMLNWGNQYMYGYGDNDKLYFGEGYFGVASMDLRKTPHGLIAGTTGCGKSNIMKCLIYQALLKEYEVVLIDFKRGVTFSGFSELIDIYFEYKETAEILEDMVKETNDRLDLFTKNGVEDITKYTQKTYKTMKRKIIFIDELAELMKVNDKTMEKRLTASIETLTRLSRAVGIHLIMGVQRPDSTVINGQIKSNVSFKLCGRFTDKYSSPIILNNNMANTLPDIKGRFIIQDDETEIIQCFYYNNCHTDFIKGIVQKREQEKKEQSAEYAIQNIPSEANKTENEKPKPKKDIEVSKGIEFDFSDITK